MIDFVSAIRTESDRFGRALASANLADRVPSCPEWSLADLVWHLSEVQYFWGSIVGGLLDDPERVEPLHRPVDGLLPQLHVEQAQRLVDRLESRDANDSCWSWHDQGHTVGWVRRRQAHEALIHRVDAELAGGSVTPLDAELATDGVDEVLKYALNLDNLPGWATYDLNGSTAVISLADGLTSWSVNLGRFRGTSPTTGEGHDFPALRLIDRPTSPTATITGTGPELDLWLWGRASPDGLSIEGDRSIVDAIRAAAIEGTQ